MTQQALELNDIQDGNEPVVFDPSRISVKDGHVIAYFLDEVLVGDVVDGVVEFYRQPDWASMSELHAFNGEAEYRVVLSKQAGKFLERTIRDKDLAAKFESGEVFAYDEAMLIIGNRTGSDKTRMRDFVKVTEAGRAVVLPGSAENKKIRVRSYFRAAPFGDDGLNETFSLWDWRFVGFEGGE